LPTPGIELRFIGCTTHSPALNGLNYPGFILVIHFSSFINVLYSSQEPITGKRWKRKKYSNTEDVNRGGQRRKEIYKEHNTRN
jgi:hypothetical protein